MTKTKPTLTEFGLEHGYLTPLEPLPPSFEPWQRIVDQLPALLSSGAIRERVHALPHISIDNLTLGQQLSAYQLVSFIGNGYVWSDMTGPAAVVPRVIAQPWISLAEALGTQPIATYVAVDIANHKDGRIKTTFTGTRDEEWFLWISYAVEAKSRPILQLVVDVMHAVDQEDVEGIERMLKTLEVLMLELYAILQRMAEKDDQGAFMNDPSVFYSQVRPYHSGWSNCKELPNGLGYETLEGVVYKKLAGGSAGQSPIIHTLDALFGVQHHPTRGATATNLEHKTTYFYEMRKYMLRHHREFLSYLEEHCHLRTFVQHTTCLQPAYDKCIEAMRKFREYHIQLVSRYIVIPAAAKKMPSVGTGGTDLMPFLKQMKEETADSKLSN